MTMKINDNGTDRDMTEIEETAYLAMVADNTKEEKPKTKLLPTKPKQKQHYSLNSE